MFHKSVQHNMKLLLNSIFNLFNRYPQRKDETRIYSIPHDLKVSFSTRKNPKLSTVYSKHSVEAPVDPRRKGILTSESLKESF